jgi:copper chaperone CopZ
MNIEFDDDKHYICLEEKVKPAKLNPSKVRVYILEFTIEGMTCSSCTNSITKAMIQNFKAKGLIKVNVVLLTHNLVIGIKHSAKEIITPEAIIDEVEAIGFEVRTNFSYHFRRNFNRKEWSI